MDADTLELLELVCIDAIRGDPPSPSVARRLEFAVREILVQRTIAWERIEVVSDRRGTTVTLLLPQPDRTVQTVRLSVE